MEGAGSRAREFFRDVAWLKSSVYFARALNTAAADSRARSRKKLDQLHATSIDVWRYSTDHKSGRERFLRESSMLDRVRGEHLFARALEIGCHEGAFTEYLAVQCEKVLALDFSPIVLDRARHRTGWGNVEFQEFDLRRDSVPQPFDLIVVNSVLETFYRPGDLHAARKKLVGALRPGDYLLLGNVRGNEVFEAAHWSRYLVRGGIRISEFFAADHRLRPISQQMDDLYVDTLFRRM